MHPEDRPYIEFQRTLNKGIKPRAERKDDKGKVVRAAHPGEFTEVWRKHLVSHRPPYEPYCWVTRDWVLCRITPDRVPIGFGNIDNLPADYPKEWKDRLLDAVSVIAGQVAANRELVEARAEIARLKGGDVKANGSGQAESGGKSEGKVQRAPGKAGQAAVHAGS